MRTKRKSFVFSAALMIGLAAVGYAQSPDVKSGDLTSEVSAVKTENIALREQLNRVEEQQKMLLEVVNDLKRRLDGQPATTVRESPPPVAPPTESMTATSFMTQPASTSVQTTSQTPDANTAFSTPSATTELARTSGQQDSVPRPQANDNRYRDGIVIWETPENAMVPFLLKFNDNTQLRYLNTLDSDRTFTDHLGVTRDVHARNDITVNRAMFILGGYIFDKRAQYSFTVWTSAGAASIVVAGNIGWRFSKAFTLTGGYTGVPGSRSLVGTFPFFTSTDRSMADNFFRPGFTQGAWASGEP